MKLTFLLLLMLVFIPTLTVRLQKLQHSWWCSKDKDSAPFMLYDEKGAAIFCPGKVAYNSYQYVRFNKAHHLLR